MVKPVSRTMAKATVGTVRGKANVNYWWVAPVSSQAAIAFDIGAHVVRPAPL